MRWSEGCWYWAKPTVTCIGDLVFFPRAVVHIVNACIVTCAVVAAMVVVVVVGCNIVTCTGGLVFFPRAVVHIVNACIVTCTVWWRWWW